MFRQYFWSFVSVVVCLGSTSVYATITADEMKAMKESMEPHILQCIEELGISEEEVQAVKSKGKDADLDPCFISCFFKKSGLFTADGMYDIEKAMEVTKAHIKSEDDLATLDKIRKECAKVNDEEVSDGDKGCDRAKMLFECFKEHKDEIDLEK